jgi:pimeloyl-ACP methyl ester carboxylesterase
MRDAWYSQSIRIRGDFMMAAARFLIVVLAPIVGLGAVTREAWAEMDPEVLTPVPIVQDARLEVRTTDGAGIIPLHLTRDWTIAQPDVRRAIVVIHGWPRRDLTSGEFAASRAGKAAGDAIIVTPQFLIEADISAHHLPESTLRWGPNDWALGGDARAPAALSSFDVLDAILRRLADRRTFPNLQNVVIAGHSAGGRFVQRYAVIGHGQAPLLNEGVHLRYVVANPSDYVYLGATRPVAPAPGCSAVDRWGYGLAGGLPRYASQSPDPERLRTAYLSKDIVYLLGTADTDPNHPQLGRSCAAEAQGPNRFERGINFVATLNQAQTLLEVTGVGHRSSQMLGSPCGVFALFETGACEAVQPNAETNKRLPQ